MSSNAMSTNVFALNERFVAAGMPAEQARVVIEAIADAQERSRDDLVTKDFLRAELQSLEGRMSKMISDSHTELSAKINDSRVEQIKWMIGLQIVLLTAVTALANFTKLL